MSNNKEYHDDEISLRSLILTIGQARRYVFQRWYIVLILGVFGFIGGYLFEKSKPMLYTASTTFILESGNSPGINAGGGLSGLLGGQLGGGAAQSLFQGQSLIELYSSSTILRKVLLTPMENDSSKLLIEKLFEINEDLFEKRNPDFDKFLANKDAVLSPTDQQLRVRDSILNVAVKALRKSYFTVDFPNSKASFIKVDTHAEDEIFAKTLNEQMVKKVSDLYMEIKAGKSYESVEVLQHKADSVQRLMLASLSRAAISADQTPNLNPTRESLRVIPVRQATSSLETNRALYTEFNRSLEMAKLSLSKEAPLIKIIDEATYPLEIQNPNPIKFGIFGSVASVVLCIIALSVLFVYRMILAD